MSKMHHAPPVILLRRHIGQFIGFLLHLGLIVVATSHSRASVDETAAASVLRLDVPLQRIEAGFRRHYIENCSAFVVATTTDTALLLSAWHCIDGERSLTNAPRLDLEDDRGYGLQQDLRRVLRHGLRYGQADHLVDVHVVAAGGSMAEDWLILSAPRSKLAGATLTPLDRRPVKLGESLIGLGWGGVSASGKKKRRRMRCDVRGVTTLIVLDCGLQKGDSGGLVARQHADGRLAAVGIISAGDSQSVTYAYPVSNLPRLAP